MAIVDRAGGVGAGCLIVSFVDNTVVTIAHTYTKCLVRSRRHDVCFTVLKRISDA